MLKESRKIFTFLLASLMAAACFIARPVTVNAEEDRKPNGIWFEDAQLKEK